MKKHIILILLSAIIFSCSGKQETVVEKRAVIVKTKSVEKTNVSFPIHTSGLLAKEDELKLSFKTGGVIKKILVNEGQNIQNGQLLAQLDLSEIQARYNQAKSGLEKSERDYKRIENLYRDTVVTYEQFQNVKTALDVARSNFKIAAFNLKHSSIKATSSGKILKRFFEENELVSPGMPVFVFANTEKEWIIKSAISDRDIVKVSVGDKAKIELDAWPDNVFRGEVKEISGGANPRSGLYNVKIGMQKNKLKLYSGFVAKVDIFPANGEQNYIIPSQALMEGNGKTGIVYTPSDDLKYARKREVIIKNILDDKIAVQPVQGELKVIITSGASYLSDNDSISIQNQE